MEFSVITILAAILALATVLPLSRSPRWWVRGLDFPRLQLAIAGLSLLAVELWRLDMDALPGQAILAITAACTLYQGWWILPYTWLHPYEVRPCAGSNDPSARISILAANVLASNRNADALLSMVRQYRPDIVVTLESNAWWQARLDTLEDDYPNTIKCPLDNRYGMHVYSRLPLEETATRFLIEANVPSMHATAMLRSGQPVQLHFVHPTPPSPTESDASIGRDAELVVVGRAVQDLDIPVIVAGDLNDVAWSATTRLFRKISGLLDPRVGRGMFNTFHAGHWYMRWPLDHLFHSRHFTLCSMARLPAFGSDHFPVLVELAHEPGAKHRQDGLEAEAEDRRRADEKLDRAGVRKPVRPADPGRRARDRPRGRPPGQAERSWIALYSRNSSSP